MAPVGNSTEHGGVCGFVRIEDLNVRTDRFCIGERRANLKTEMCSSIVQRRDRHRIVELGDDNAGTPVIQRDGCLFALLHLSRMQALQPIGRKAWQTQAENTPVA